MRQQKAASFFRNWKKVLGWRRGCRIVVVLENRWEWDNLPGGFREDFIWYYEVLFLELEMGSLQLKRELFKKDFRILLDWQPEVLVGVGGFCLLQRVCLLRDGLGSERTAVLLFSGRDRWQSFFRDALWIRGGNGQTEYWGYMEKNKQDVLVLMREGELWEGLTDRFAREIDKFCMAFRKVCAKSCGTECDSIERDICEELAEPLRVLYGIPIEIGRYFSLLYLYQLFSEWERKAVCRLLRIEEGHADWCLERLAQEYCGAEVDGILLPEQDVPMLTQMAMEGIENYPRRQQPGWEQVELFYRGLCR